MRLILNQAGFNFRIFDSKDTHAILYSAEIFTNRKQELLKVFNADDMLVATIRQTNYKRLQWDWNCVYEISLLDSKETYIVTCIKFAKRHWTATSNNNKILDYYGHNGHKKSIFREEKQIALIDKTFFNFFNRNTLYIDLNNNENSLLILTFALVFELDVDTDKQAITFDLGAYGQARKWDENWRPK